MRLFNSLLDRLTDLNPEVRQETGEYRAASLHSLKQSIQRDIGWLLNAVCLNSVQDLSAYPYVAESVVNYGLRDIAGKTILGTDLDAIAQLIQEVILKFEPRLIQHTVRVSVLYNPKSSLHRNVLLFLIEGDMWTQSFPERLYFRTELDLETGEIQLIEQRTQ